MTHNSCDILISVDGRHASNMLSGEKSVELRRKPLNIPSGTRVWIYSKLPRGQIQALALVDEVVSGTPKEIWNLYGSQCAISEDEFHAYFENVKISYAIVFDEIKALAPVLSLASIREQVSHFQPPQFFKRLHADGPELAFFNTAVVGT